MDKSEGCYMFSADKGKYRCRALNTMKQCGKNCPFHKTLEEQRKIEKKCRKRCTDEGYIFMSAIGGENE